MSRYVIIIVIALIACGVFFFVANNNEPMVQKGYKIVAFGDSLTAGYGVNEVDSYPSVLQQRLQLKNPNISVINMGVSGEMTAAGLQRIDDIIEQKPDVVLLGLGANDILRSIGTVEVKSNLESIVKKLQEHNIQVILLGMRTSLNSVATYRKEFNEIYPELAKKYNVTLVPFFLEGIVLKSDLNIADRLHPNKAGYIKIVDENIMPVIGGMFR